MIEDDVDDFHLFREIASQINPNVNLFLEESHADVAERLKTTSIDLIVMDYNLPLMNGLEQLQQIRSLQQGENIRVIVFSGFVPTAVVQKIYELRGTYINKPTSYSTFISVVREMLHGVSQC